jgi:hypothetical protein
MLRVPAESRAWLMGEEAGRRLAPILGQTEHHPTDETLRWAALWAAMVDDVVPLIATGRVSVITYESLVADLAGHTRRLATAWADSVPSEGFERDVALVASLDSKLPGRPFAVDPSRPLLDVESVQRIAPIVQPGLERLAAVGVMLADV